VPEFPVASDAVPPTWCPPTPSIHKLALPSTNDDLHNHLFVSPPQSWPTALLGCVFDLLRCHHPRFVDDHAIVLGFEMTALDNGSDGNANMGFVPCLQTPMKSQSKLKPIGKIKHAMGIGPVCPKRGV
jgi:hypothetical protein